MTTETPTPTPKTQLDPSAVALHYQHSAQHWEGRALALQNQLTLVTNERDQLADEVERLRNPPVVTAPPASKV